MPNYDLRCADCKTEFKIRASISDRTERRILCPECGSHELDAVFKSMFFSVKRDMPSCPNSSVCGAGCPHAHSH